MAEQAHRVTPAAERWTRTDAAGRPGTGWSLRATASDTGGTGVAARAARNRAKLPTDNS